MSRTKFLTDKDLKLTPSHLINKDILEKKNHFERPEVSNIEITIFLNRLIKIFENTTTKLEFAATLSLILSHPTLPEVLNENDLTQIKSTFSFISSFRKDSKETKSSHLKKFNFQKSKTSSKELNIQELSCNGSYKTNESCSSLEHNINVYNALQILMSNKYICQLSKKYEKDVEKVTTNFMRQIKYFMDFIILKTKLMPNEERDDELRLRHVCKELDQTKSDVSALITFLEKQKKSHQAEAKELLQQVENSLEAWKNITQEFEKQTTEALKTSEYNLTQLNVKFTKKLNHHEQTLENFKIQIQKEKLKNRKIETEVRGKRLKVQSQLVSFINKFDSDVSDMQEAYDKLMNEYKALEDEKAKLTEEMEEQLIIYQKIITEKEEKEYSIFIKKYTKFIRTRSAKIIQQWWRKISAEKKKKKKKRKGKK